MIFENCWNTKLYMLERGEGNGLEERERERVKPLKKKDDSTVFVICYL